MAGNDITFNLTFDDVFRDRAKYIQRRIDIVHNSGVKQYATIDNFIDAQNNGITAEDYIPNNINVKFDKGSGTNFEDALEDIKLKQTQRQWMWYILPSNIDSTTATATFFKLGPETTYQTTITEYLNDDTLRNNYITMINAIYDKIKDSSYKAHSLEYIIHIGNENKRLKSSITNFITPLLNKLNTLKLEPPNIRNNIQELYKIVNNKEYKAPT